MSTVLVIAAHPDDEILGVGGTAARRSEEGDNVYALILGEGQTSRWDAREQAEQGSYHTIKDLEDLNKRIYFEWSDNIGEFLERYKAIGTSI